MTDQEVKRLSRSELLEMLIAQQEENETLKSRLEQAEAQLKDRQIAIENAGSLAEAALSINGVFRAAEEAAQQYLDNIRQRSEEQEAACRDMQAEAEPQATETMQRAQAYSDRVHADADAYSSKVHADADAYNDKVHADADAYNDRVHADADAYWGKVVAQAARLLQEQDMLREVVQSVEGIEGAKAE